MEEADETLRTRLSQERRKWMKDFREFGEAQRRAFANCKSGLYCVSKPSSDKKGRLFKVGYSNNFRERFGWYKAWFDIRLEAIVGLSWEDSGLNCPDERHPRYIQRRRSEIQMAETLLLTTIARQGLRAVDESCEIASYSEQSLARIVCTMIKVRDTFLREARHGGPPLRHWFLLGSDLENFGEAFLRRASPSTHALVDGFELRREPVNYSDEGRDGRDDIPTCFQLSVLVPVRADDDFKVEEELFLSKCVVKTRALVKREWRTEATPRVSLSEIAGLAPSKQVERYTLSSDTVFGSEAEDLKLRRRNESGFFDLPDARRIQIERPDSLAQTKLKIIWDRNVFLSMGIGVSRPTLTNETQCTSTVSPEMAALKAWNLVWRCLAERDDVLLKLTRCPNRDLGAGAGRLNPLTEGDSRRYHGTVESHIFVVWTFLGSPVISLEIDAVWNRRTCTLYSPHLFCTNHEYVGVDVDGNRRFRCLGHGADVVEARNDDLELEEISRLRDRKISSTQLLLGNRGRAIYDERRRWFGWPMKLERDRNQIEDWHRARLWMRHEKLVRTFADALPVASESGDVSQPGPFENGAPKPPTERRGRREKARSPGFLGRFFGAPQVR